MTDNIRAAIHVHKKAWAALKTLGRDVSDDVLNDAHAAERDALRILVRILPRDNRDATARINYLMTFYEDYLSRTHHDEQHDGPHQEKVSAAPV